MRKNKLITKPVKLDKMPSNVLKRFELSNLDFYVDIFEEMILKDMAISNQDIGMKLNRNVTQYFNKWIETKLKNKENISISVMGVTRSGKSLVGLKIADNIVRNYKNDYDTNKIICGNQKEFRLNLMKAQFGDVFQVDENAFSNGGIGTSIEAQQLKDVQNIIAKMNIHTIYITPKAFIGSNSEIGLNSWGKDLKNWVSRFLLYSLRRGVPTLIGYIIINVGSVFLDYGCLLFKEIGGCNNTNKYTIETITPELIQYSACIPKKYKSMDIKTMKKELDKTLNEDERNKKVCPFYNVCMHPICAYEHKKDKWIDKEMKGGLDERTKERYIIALKLLNKFGIYDEENNIIKLNARSGKELKIKAKLEIPKVTNTKLSITEQDEVFEILKAATDIKVLADFVIQTDMDYKKELKDIENNDVLLIELNKIIKQLKRANDKEKNQNKNKKTKK